MRGVTEYKQKSIVSGLSVKKILSMDVSEFNKLNKRDLQKITGRLVSAGNKRLRRAEEAGVTSPAFAFIRDNGGFFSTKDKNINQLRSEFVRAKNFLESETGTIKGAIKFRKESIAALKQQGVNISDENFDKVMRAYEGLKRSNPQIKAREFKYAVLQEIEEITEPDTDEETLMTTINNRIEDIYKKMQRDNTINGVSGFITIDDEWQQPF